MGEMKREAAPKCLPFSAQQVADTFVQQYYHILRASPENLHKFYKDCSIMARPGSDGMMVFATTMQGINDAIMSCDYKGCDPIVEAVHAQDSIMGSVIVGVTGTLTDKENIKRKFAETFFLAPQETGGFYVRNDFIQFVHVDEPTTSLSDLPEVPEALLKTPTASSPKNSEVAHVSNDEQVTISVSDPTPKAAFEILNKLGAPSSPKNKKEIPVKKSDENVQEDGLKKVSYASVLAKEAPLSTAAHVPSPPVAGVTKASPPAPPKAASTPPNGDPNINDGLAAEAPKGIHIKDLPLEMTQEGLLEEVKKFGAVRPNGVHIRKYPEDGYRFAFVEFESAKSARSAVEASEIRIGGWKFEVQYRRSSNQGGNNQGPSMYGRGGYRNDTRGSREWEGHGGRDGEPCGSNWRSSTQAQVLGGSSTATKCNSRFNYRCITEDLFYPSDFANLKIQNLLQFLFFSFIEGIQYLGNDCVA